LLLSQPWRKQTFARFVEPVLDEAVAVPCEVRTLSDTIRQQALESTC
jgi:hypothetical protein